MLDVRRNGSVLDHAGDIVLGRLGGVVGIQHPAIAEIDGAVELTLVRGGVALFHEHPVIRACRRDHGGLEGGIGRTGEADSDNGNGSKQSLDAHGNSPSRE